MAKGNTWTYVQQYFPVDTNEGNIFDTTEIAGKTYHLHKGWEFGYIGITPLAVDTLRTDSLGRVCRFENQHEYMVFDFSTGGNYLSHTSYPEVDTVHVQHQVEITVPAGHFTNCVDLFFRRSFYDESVGYVFAPGVGIVKWYGPFLGTNLLLRATIDGKLISAVDRIPTHVPIQFNLNQNYPNPFNPTTVVSYQLPVVSNVKLAVYDILGREVSVLVNERKDAGSYEVKFDATNLASGVYFYRLQAGDFTQTRRLLLLR